MRIENISLDNYSIFINNSYIDIGDYTDKNNIVKKVKEIIIKIQSMINLYGFYKVKVYVCKKIGLFIDIIKIDSNYSDNLDLRVIVFLDEDVYVGVDDYFLVSDVKDIRNYNDKYYVKVNDLDNILNILEFGNFIYGTEVQHMLNNSVFV